MVSEYRERIASAGIKMKGPILKIWIGIFYLLSAADPFLTVKKAMTDPSSESAADK